MHVNDECVFRNAIAIMKNARPPPYSERYFFYLTRRTRINELRNLQYLPRLSEARETMFEDRTKAHADHVGHGHERMTTAAVGEYKPSNNYSTIFVA